MATEVLVPVLGESITEATLGEWLNRMIIDGDLQASQLPNGRWLVNRTDVEVIAAQLTRGT